MVVYAIGLVILWIVVSVPVYFAGKLVRGERARFGDALGATLGGVIVYYVVFLVVSLALGAVIGPSAGPVGVFLGILAWLAVFRRAFRTSWLGALGIVILAWVILVVIYFVLGAIFAVMVPDFFPL